MARIHHVTLATRDFTDTAAWLLEDYGLAAILGYKFPHAGWSNLLVPVGGEGHQYIEVLGVTDPEQAARCPYGGAIDALTVYGDRFVAWALLDEDVAGTAKRLGIEPEEWSAISPTGERVSWNLVGTVQSWTEPFLPFFRDDPPAFHGSLDAQLAHAQHRVEPAGFAWVELHGDEDRLREWVGGEAPQARIEPGTPELRSVAIATENGKEIVIKP